MSEQNATRTAVIAGATGLVGQELLKQLLADPDYNQVVVILRKPLDVVHPKLVQKVIDFDALPGALDGLKASDGFCSLGTTIKTAGSKERQYRVDHDYVVNFALGCSQAGVSRFAVVSSIGSDAASSNFYLRTKGEMERDLKQITFNSLYILQPSLLLGDRKEYRAGEKIAGIIMTGLGPFMIGGMKKYRGVKASAVAGTMIAQTRSATSGVHVIPSDRIR